MPSSAGGGELGGQAPSEPLPLGFCGWAHLTEVDPDEEVKGEIHLRLQVKPSPQCRLRCSVLEAR